MKLILSLVELRPNFLVKQVNQGHIRNIPRRDYFWLGDRETIRAPDFNQESALAHTDNNLLARLAPDDIEMFGHRLRIVDLIQGSDLLTSGDPIRHIYFPHSGIISLVVRLKTGGVIEAAMVGRDSLFGASAALDGQIGLYDAIVQLSGRASVLDAEVLRGSAEKSAALRKTLIRHEQALFAQALQSTACNAAHTVESRLARWLLRARDLGGDVLALTQEFLGQMLGVRRPSVSAVANTLQQAGLITDSRGNIKITDVDGLMGCACECYGTVKSQCDRLLGNDHSAAVPK